MTGPANTWRDRVKVHPAADLFPLMSDDELDDLAKDIAENGLQQPVVFWTPEQLGKRPKEVYLLDGRNRLAAIERVFAKDAPRCAEEIESALYIGNNGARLLSGHYDDPWAYVASANLHRRHLTRDQKRDLIAELLKADPARSDRAIAKTVAVSHPYVAKVRAEGEESGTVETVSTRVGLDGVAQPAAKPPKALSKEAQLRALRERHVAPPISKAGAASHAERPEPPAVRDLDELKSVLAMLRGDPRRIANLPMGKRVALARVCLAFLNLTLDDLLASEGAT